MKINRENYEIYFIDYFDGGLNTIDIAELMAFLSENPDLEDEFNNFKKLQLPDNTNEFRGKNSLYRSFNDVNDISEMNFDEFCIAASEGDLDVVSEKKLKEYIKDHPEKEKDYQIFTKLKLNADSSIVFNGKNFLKKKEKFLISKRFIYYSTSIAAAVFFAVLLFLNNKTETPQITETEGIKSNKGTEIISASESTMPDNTSEPKISVNKPKSKPVVAIFNETVKIEIQNEVIRENPVEPIAMIEIKSIDHKIRFEEITPGLNYKTPEKIVPPLTISKNEISIPYDKINLLTIAEAGIKGMNFLTESDIKLEKKLDENGRIIEFGFESQQFGFSKQRKK